MALNRRFVFILVFEKGLDIWIPFALADFCPPASGVAGITDVTTIHILLATNVS
jgi:hypothetical protein